MKLIILSLITSSSYVLGSGLVFLRAPDTKFEITSRFAEPEDEGVPSKKEFLINNENWVNRHLAKVKMASTPCNKYFDPKTAIKESACFGISAGDKGNMITDSKDFSKSSLQDLHSPETKLMSLLHIIEGKKDVVSKLIKEQKVDFVGVVMASDPGCYPSYLPVKTLANTMVGPGSISISRAKDETTASEWRVGGSMGFATSPLNPLGSLEIELSADYINSHESTTKKALQREYSAPQGSTCTPSSLQVSIYCRGTSQANVVYGSKGKVVSERNIVIKPTLLPNEKGDAEYFTSITGCIDYSK